MIGFKSVENATLEKTRVDFGIIQGLMQVGWSEWVKWTGNNCGPVAGKCRVFGQKMVKFRSCHWNGMATGMLRNNSDWFSEMLGCSLAVWPYGPVCRAVWDMPSYEY